MVQRFLILAACILCLSVPQGVFALGGYDSLHYGGYESVHDGNSCSNTFRCYCDAELIASQSDEYYTSTSACASHCATIRATKWSMTCTTYTDEQNVAFAGETIDYGTTSTEIVEGSGEDFVTPNLNVDIPGVDFENSIGYDASGNIQANFFGEYVDGVYRYLIPAMALVAVVILMVSGLQYILARGASDAIKKAKQRMANAVIGLVLLLAAYNLGYLLDPNTVFFEGLSIKEVSGVPLPEEPADELGTTPIANEEISTGLTTIEGDHLIAPTSSNGQYIAEEVLEALNEGADAFYEASKELNKGEGVNVRVTSASRTVTKQAQLFYTNCLSDLSSSGIGACSTGTCDPTGSSLGKSSVIKYLGSSRYQLIGDLSGVTDATTIKAALVAHGNTSYCPHTTNIAIDIWPEGSTKSNANVALMDLLTATMLDHGFCRIDIEAWHFQLNSLSGASCKSYAYSHYTWRGKTYETTGCSVWDFASNVCKVPVTTE